MFVFPANSHPIKTDFHAPTHDNASTFDNPHIDTHAYPHCHPNNQANAHHDFYTYRHKYTHSDENRFPYPHAIPHTNANPFSRRNVTAPGRNNHEICSNNEYEDHPEHTERCSPYHLER
jgi:hypothetical protein